MVALNHLVRVDRFNAGEPREVGHIEGDDLRNVVGFHDGHEAGIVNLGTHNGVIDDQPAPSSKHLERIRKDREELLQLVGVAIPTVDAQTQAIHVKRSRADIPEFRDIL